VRFSPPSAVVLLPPAPLRVGLLRAGVGASRRRRRASRAVLSRVGGPEAAEWAAAEWAAAERAAAERRERSAGAAAIRPPSDCRHRRACGRCWSSPSRPLSDILPSRPCRSADSPMGRTPHRAPTPMRVPGHSRWGSPRQTSPPHRAPTRARVHGHSRSRWRRPKKNGPPGRAQRLAHVLGHGRCRRRITRLSVRPRRASGERARGRPPLNGAGGKAAA